jgi:predicted MFS family arabinose efflux permease
LPQLVRGRSRGALGTYNFAGDLGKMALPAITAGLIAVMSWRLAAGAVGIIALLGSGAILLAPWCVPAADDKRTGASPSKSKPHERTDQRTDPPRSGFTLLLAVGVIDSATRMGFLTFLPFLLRAKGASLAEIGVALTLVFAGGAAGKLVCGFVGARLGVLAIAGFASTIGWPVSAVFLHELGWRAAWLIWAGLNLLLAAPLNWLSIPRHGTPTGPRQAATELPAAEPPRAAMPILAFFFATTWFVHGAMAAHLPGLLRATRHPRPQQSPLRR